MFKIWLEKNVYCTGRSVEDRFYGDNDKTLGCVMREHRVLVLDCESGGSGQQKRLGRLRGVFQYEATVICT